MDFLLPVIVLSVPVLAVVVIAMVSGRRLSGSCGGVGPDGRCSRCGQPAEEVQRLRIEGRGSDCP